MRKNDSWDPINFIKVDLLNGSIYIFIILPFRVDFVVHIYFRNLKPSFSRRPVPGSEKTNVLKVDDDDDDDLIIISRSSNTLVVFF